MNGKEMAFEPRLLIGCDGLHSIVRRALVAHAPVSPDGSGGSRFIMNSLPTPSAGLRFLVLRLPPNPRVTEDITLENGSLAVLRVSHTSGMTPMGMWGMVWGMVQ